MLEKAIKEALKTSKMNYGGPFGALIVDKNNEIVVISSNTVLKDNDPTAHAEVNAIRMACEKLKTNDLSEYSLYTTSYPCPMCLSAAIWANIKKIYYGAKVEGADAIGFRDQEMYEFFKTEENEMIELEYLENEECLRLLNEYNGKMY